MVKGHARTQWSISSLLALRSHVSSSTLAGQGVGIRLLLFPRLSKYYPSFRYASVSASMALLLLGQLWFPSWRLSPFSMIPRDLGGFSFGALLHPAIGGVMCVVHPPQREASLWLGSAGHRILLGFLHIVGDGSMFEEQERKKGERRK